MHAKHSLLTLALLSFVLAAACKKSEPVQAAPKVDVHAEPVKEAAPAPAEPQAAEVADAAPEPEGAFSWEREKIGPLQRGQTTEQVEKLLGKPAEAGDEEFSPATGEYSVFWRYEDKGVSATFTSEEEGGVKTLSSISLFPPSTLKTSRGIGIGSTRAEAEKAYANTNAEGEADESDESQVIVGSVYGGLSFTIEDGAVKYVFSGASAE